MSVTLFAHMSPQALQRVLGPSGPRRIIGVDFSLMPQCRQLQANEIKSVNQSIKQ